MLHSALNAALVPLLLFCAITLLFSALTGAFFLSSPLSVLVGLLGTWFLCTRFPVSIEIPAIVWVLTVLLLALLLYPILLRGGVDGSADAVSAIATRLMDSKIPATYAPYSDIAYNYQIGFPLLARAVNDFLFFIPDHQIVWMLGALFSALLIPLVYWFCRAFNGSADTALVAAVLVFGTKLVFQDFYYGEYAWALATVLYLCALILWKKRNPLFLLLIPAILTVHPAIALNFLFFAAVLLVFGWLPLEFLVPAVLSGMLALPAFFYTYLPLLKNIAGGAGRDPFSLSSALNNVALVPPWIGTGLSIAFGIAFVLVVWRKRTTPRLPVWPLFIAAFALVLFGLFSGLGNVLPGRIIELVMLGVLVWTAFAWGTSDLFSRYRTPLLVGLLVLGLVSFQTASILVHLRTGSKITPNQVEFANEFREIDPTPQETIFLSTGAGKMAVLADKIPFDANTNFMISTAEFLVVKDAAWDEFKRRHAVQQEIRNSACVQCVLDLPDLKYAVIDPDYAPITLDRPVLLERNGLRLYQLR
jgi:hypothetical protein